MTIDEVLDLLTRFQDSSVQREREVFYCMISNLFEEYKYFPQYPERELHITAQLFGGIIGEFREPCYVYHVFNFEYVSLPVSGSYIRLSSFQCW